MCDTSIIEGQHIVVKKGGIFIFWEEGVDSERVEYSSGKGGGGGRFSESPI